MPCAPILFALPYGGALFIFKQEGLIMSESQSRYSIVERLTSQKLEIMDEKQRIIGDIEAKKVKLLQMRAQRKSKELKLKAEIEAELNMYDCEIKELEQKIATDQSGKTTKSALCDAKITQIDNALKAIQDISRASADEASK